MRTKLLFVVVAFSVLLGSIHSANAQWQTQSFVVKPGWTAFYSHVDLSYTNLDYLVGSDTNNPISEIWMWVPTASTIQYVTSPQQPTTSVNQWSSWVRGGAPGATLVSMIPNAAYLIHSLATNNYTWNLKGKPATPNYIWTETGINFLDFPTPPSNPPFLSNFLLPAPSLQAVAQIYQYTGGKFGPNNPNPLTVPQESTVQATRGTAFWIRAGSFYNTYFGPFQVGLGSSGMAFGDSSSQTSFHLQNVTASPVTVQLTLLPSESPPAGQSAVLGLPPLLLRGALNPTNLTYSASNLTTTTTLTWTLPPQGQSGADIVINLGVNRSALAGRPAGLYAGILKFTDTTGLTELDVPVSAQPSSYAGLWAGSASVSQVANYLKSYQLGINNNPVPGTNGAYVVTSINTNLGPVSSAFPLRLILHSDGTNVNLLQRVFYGSDVNSNLLVATSESALDPAQRGNARRITSVQLPFTTTNRTWSLAGQLAPGGTLTTVVDLPYDDHASNPFLHTYHPDHDNLDATFKNELPVGSESYGIRRQITLTLNSAGNDYASLTQFGQSFQGAYNETITMTGLGNAKRNFNTAGSFSLSRVSPIAVLTRP
jgi:hypothetical protein